MKSSLQLIVFGFIFSNVMGNPFDRSKRQIVFPQNNNQDPPQFQGFGGLSFNGNDGQGNDLTNGNGLVGGQQQQQQGGPTTQSAPTDQTTPSRAYLRCLANCPTTMEYNPVCGSDDQSYHNEQRLQCAQRCGAAVSLVRRGSCLPRLAPVANPNNQN